MSEFEFKAIHKFFPAIISSILYLKKVDIISLHVYNIFSYKKTLPLELLGYCETNATIPPTVETAYRLNNTLKLLEICQSSILKEKLSIISLISDSSRNTDYITKTPYFKPIFQVSKYTTEQKKFVKMFNFQHSQIAQQEFKQLAELLLKYPMVYTATNFDVGKVNFTNTLTPEN